MREFCADDGRPADHAVVDLSSGSITTRTRPTTRESASRRPRSRGLISSSTTRFASSMSSFLPGVQPPAGVDVRRGRGRPVVDQPLDRVRDLQLAARRGLDAFEIASRIVRRRTGRRRPGPGSLCGCFGLLLQARHPAVAPAPPRRTAAGCPTASSRIRAFALQRPGTRSTKRDDPVLDEVVAQVHDEGLSPRNSRAVQTAWASPRGSSCGM